MHCLCPSSDELFADPNAKDRKGSMFVLVSEESEVGRIRFGCRDNTERDSWMKWLARATGQNFEPSQTDSGTQRGEVRGGEELLCYSW